MSQTTLQQYCSERSGRSLCRSYPCTRCSRCFFLRSRSSDLSRMVRFHFALRRLSSLHSQRHFARICKRLVAATGASGSTHGQTVTGQTRQGSAQTGQREAGRSSSSAISGCKCSANRSRGCSFTRSLQQTDASRYFLCVCIGRDSAVAISGRRVKAAAASPTAKAIGRGCCSELSESTEPSIPLAEV